MSRITIIITFLLVISFAHAEEPPVRTIKVAGVGTASSPPDQATISSDVVTSAKTAKEALSTNKVTVEKIIAAMKEEGIPEEDIQTILFMVEPEFEPRRGGQKLDIMGYRVTKRLQLKVRNLDKLGQILDALDSAGGRIRDVKVGVANRVGLLNKSRKRAMVDARKSATVYVKPVRLVLGAIISITETHVDDSVNLSSCVGEDVGRWDIASGQLNVTSGVFVVFIVNDRVPQFPTPGPTPLPSPSPVPQFENEFQRN